MGSLRQGQNHGKDQLGHGLSGDVRSDGDVGALIRRRIEVDIVVSGTAMDQLQSIAAADEVGPDCDVAGNQHVQVIDVVEHLLFGLEQDIHVFREDPVGVCPGVFLRVGDNRNSKCAHRLNPLFGTCKQRERGTPRQPHDPKERYAPKRCRNGRGTVREREGTPGPARRRFLVRHDSMAGDLSSRQATLAIASEHGQAKAVHAVHEPSFIRRKPIRRAIEAEDGVDRDG